jgi:hypothetical protein
MNTLLARTVLAISLGYAGFIVAAEEETKESLETFWNDHEHILNPPKDGFARGCPEAGSFIKQEMKKNSSANQLVPVVVISTVPSAPQQSQSQRAIHVIGIGARIASKILGFPF